MSDHVNIGTITITYDMTDDGDMLTGVSVDGDMPIVTQLELLDLARDTILAGCYDTEDEA